MAREILIWWLVVQALGLAGLPLASVLFRALPGHGYAFGKPLGLLLTGYLAWLIAMLGLAPFGRGLIVVCALALGLGGLLLKRRPGDNPSTRAGDPASLGIAATPAQPTFAFAALRGALISWIREHWRMALGYELLFALALVFLALLRSHDYGFVGPNPWGTERPMDYALFNAIQRSPNFPPHDPWLSGYSINYYYFGYLLMAVVALLSGLEPAVAYNLALALIFALTALGSAGIVASLIALTPHAAQEARTHRSGRVSAALRTFVTLLTVVIVLVAGNQAGALQVIVGDNRVVALDGRQLAAAIGQALSGKQTIALPSPASTSDFDTFSTLERKDRIAEFDWWWPSRVVWDDYTRRGDPRRHYTITEFPFFSFWLGDMHPHVMALPFGLLALALALQTAARPTAPAFTLGQRGWFELALTGIVLGSLYVINSWDFPTYVLLFLGALLLLYVRLGNAGQERSETEDGAPNPPPVDRFAVLDRVWWRHYLSQAALALIAALVLFTPFHLTFRSLVGGKDPLVDLPVLATITRTLGVVSWSKTGLHSFLIIFGLFLLPLVAYVVLQGRAGKLRRSAALETEADQGGPSLPVSSPGARLWAMLAVLALGLLIGFPLLVLLPLGLYAAMLALERADRLAEAFVLWAFGLGCLICFGTEIVYIRDVFESRMNTIFKFYYQAWLIWGVLAGYALWWLARSLMTGAGSFTYAQDERWTLRMPLPLRAPLAGSGHGSGQAIDDGRRTTDGGSQWHRLTSRISRLASLALTALFCTLLAGALVYPWLTAGKAFREGHAVGLHGTTPRERTPEGAAAIAWLRTHAPSNAVVLEAAGESSYEAYDGRGLGIGGVSASTGLATVIGWAGHERQWRGGDPAVYAQIEQRYNDVTTIYRTTDVAQARELLRRYAVDYIYVGAAERALYPPEGLAKLAQLGVPVFQQGEVTIYQVG